MLGLRCDDDSLTGVTDPEEDCCQVEPADARVPPVSSRILVNGEFTQAVRDDDKVSAVGSLPKRHRRLRHIPLRLGQLMPKCHRRRLGCTIRETRHTQDCGHIQKRQPDQIFGRARLDRGFREINGGLEATAHQFDP